MKKTLFAFVFMALFAIPSMCLAAEPTVSAKEPEKILEIAKGFGSAELSVDSAKDPRIVGRIDGQRYAIYFYGCENNKDCSSIQFVAGWALEEGKRPSSTVINEWNRTKRYGKAYIDSDGDPMLEVDLPLDSVPTAHLERWFRWWQVGLKGFKKHIGME